MTSGLAHKRSFRTQVIVALVLSAFVPMILAGVPLIYQAYTSSANYSMERLQLRAANASSRVQNNLAQAMVAISGLASSQDIIVSANSVLLSGMASHRMRPLVNDSPLVEQMYLLDIDGLTVESYPERLDNLMATDLRPVIEEVMARPDIGRFSGGLVQPKLAITKDVGEFGKAVAAVFPLDDPQDPSGPTAVVVALVTFAQVEQSLQAEFPEQAQVRLNNSIMDMRQFGHDHITAELAINLPGERDQLLATVREPSALHTSHLMWTVIRLATLSFAAVALAVLFGWILVRRLTDPLEQLIGLVRQYGEGRYDAKAPDMPYEELDAVSNQLVAMGERITEQIDTTRERTMRAAAAEFRARRSEETRQIMLKTTQMLAHDIRKPFSMIKVLVRTLDRVSDPHETQQLMATFLPDLHRTMGTVDGMISEIKEFSQSPRLALGPVSITTLVVNSLAEVFVARSNCDVVLQHNYSHDHQWRGDGVRILRVVANIVDNAVDAMRQRGTISFTTEPIQRSDGLFISLRIHNTGSYIPESYIGRIFDAFFTKDKSDGTGLGLAIAKKMIDAHGGDLMVSSDVATGTTFEVILPADSGAVEVELPRFPEHSSEFTSTHAENLEEIDPTALEHALRRARNTVGRKVRVLIIDDEPLYISDLIDSFRSAANCDECAVLVDVRDSGSALDVAREFRPDLVISDHHLDRDSITGYELLREFRQGQPVITCLHSNDHDLREHIDSDLVTMFLPKPMRIDSLARLLDLVSESRQAKETSDSA